MMLMGLGSNVWADISYAVRGLKNTLAYAVTIVLTLSLGLGAATTTLAIVNSVLLRPLVLPHPEQLVVLLLELHGKKENAFSFEQIRALNERQKLFTAVSGYSSIPRPVSTADGSQTTIVTHVSANFFRMLDTPAKLGRMFTEADKAAPVAVVSDAFWRDRLHSGPRAIGSTIKAAGEQLTIVGIAPRGIHFPQNLDGPQVYTPEKMISQRQDSDLNSGEAVAARIRPGVSIRQAQEEAGAVFSRIDGASAPHHGTLLLQSFQSYLTGDVRPALLSLFGGGVILLLMACGNAANLQIARGAGRISEMNVRSALGASRFRLLQQIVTDSVVVSMLGAAFGMLLAYGLVSEIRSVYGQRFPRFDELAIHISTFLLCALLAAVVGALASIAPALNVLRHAGTLGGASTRTATRSRIPGALVVAQIALTCVLLIVTGLLVRTFHALQSVELGFEPHGVTSMVLMPTSPHQSPEVSRELDRRLLEKFAALPGVEASALQSSVPFSNFDIQMDHTIEVNGRTFQKGDSTRFSLVVCLPPIVFS
jgi:predicted permease